MANQFPASKIFHVFNKSIVNFGIFKDLDNCQRFINTLDYYNNTLITESFSKFLEKKPNFNCENLILIKKYSCIKFLCFIIMPDHYHLLIKVLKQNCLSKYISDVENSYTRYFNIKFNRKGPLWQSTFKTVRIKTNAQLLHVSRYIHLNATTSSLVNKPEEWKFSSYRKFIEDENTLKRIVTEISISSPILYKKFVEDQIEYQQKLKLIKKLILE